MEIVVGESAYYRPLTFISLKMELHWRSNPVGKVRPNLPSTIISANFPIVPVTARELA
jgi:hypothetical protein